jgi:hypothetical protein
MLTALLIYLAIGTVAGLLAGLLGVGGGLIIVPSLLYAFRSMGYSGEIVLHLALGTSLAAIVFNAIASVRAHHRRDAVRWQEVSRLAQGLLLGTLAGSVVAKWMETDWLQLFFGFFAISVGLQMLTMGRCSVPAARIQTIVGAVIGFISALVGIGGGSLTVPYLNACRYNIREAVATSSACGLPIALAGSLGYLLAGWGDARLPAHTMGFIHLPALLIIALFGMIFAPVGAHFAHLLPTSSLKRIFGLLLLLLGLHMALSTIL